MAFESLLKGIEIEMQISGMYLFLLCKIPVCNLIWSCKAARSKDFGFNAFKSDRWQESGISKY